VHSNLLLVIVVATALVFDFTNGFHDTANVVASAISTRAMTPRLAVALASLLNFAGALISLKVAATIATGIVSISSVSSTVAFAGLAGAIVWNLTTWSYGLPSSSSHALIGSVIGALIAGAGTGAVHWHAVLMKVIIPAVIAPLLAFAVASVAIILIYRACERRSPGPVTRAFRGAQLVSSSALALAHGSNDAQKTMGIIGVALVANGSLSGGAAFHVPLWVVLAAAAAMGFGTYAGGWRIIRTVGTRIIKMDAAQGMVAQGAGAAVILLSSHFGYPLSSTQVISGGIMGAGAGKSVSAVRWGVASDILTAWLLTLPLAGLAGAGAYGITAIFGSGALGPLLIIAGGVAAAVLTVRLRRPWAPAEPTRHAEPSPAVRVKAT
jgi:inorganic phosphate transporter, PiT family